MADYAKREERPDEIYKAKSSSSRGVTQKRLSPYEQMAIRNWRNFTPEGRRQVHNERFHGAAWYGGPGTDTKVEAGLPSDVLGHDSDQMEGKFDEELKDLEQTETSSAPVAAEKEKTPAKIGLDGKEETGIPPIWFEVVESENMTTYYLHLSVNLTYAEDLEENPGALSEYWHAKNNLLAKQNGDEGGPRGLAYYIAKTFTSNSEDPLFKAAKIEFKVREADINLQDEKSAIKFKVVDKIEDASSERTIGRTSEIGDIEHGNIRVEINDRYFERDTIHDKESQFLRTFLHEIGHLLGLRHPKEENSGFAGSTEEERAHDAGILNLMNQSSDLMDFFSDHDAQNTIFQKESDFGPINYSDRKSISPLDRTQLTFDQFQKLLYMLPEIKK